MTLEVLPPSELERAAKFLSSSSLPAAEKRAFLTNRGLHDQHIDDAYDIALRSPVTSTSPPANRLRVVTPSMTHEEEAEGNKADQEGAKGGGGGAGGTSTRWRARRLQSAAEPLPRNLSELTEADLDLLLAKEISESPTGAGTRRLSAVQETIAQEAPSVSPGAAWRKLATANRFTASAMTTPSGLAHEPRARSPGPPLQPPVALTTPATSARAANIISVLGDEQQLDRHDAIDPELASPSEDSVFQRL